MRNPKMEMMLFKKLLEINIPDKPTRTIITRTKEISNKEMEMIIIVITLMVSLTKIQMKDPYHQITEEE